MLTSSGKEYAFLDNRNKYSCTNIPRFFVPFFFNIKVMRGVRVAIWQPQGKGQDGDSHKIK